MTTKTNAINELKSVKYILQSFPSVLEKFEQFERECKKFYGDDETRHYSLFLFHLIDNQRDSNYSAPFSGMLTGSIVCFWARVFHNDGLSLDNIIEGKGIYMDCPLRKTMPYKFDNLQNKLDSAFPGI